MIESLFNLDVPTLAKILGFSIGLLWGEAFREWDGMIKYHTGWYQQLNPFWKWFVGCLLDTQHHFQYGLVMIIAALKLRRIITLFPWTACFSVFTYATLNLIVLYLGVGLVVSDLKDYQHVVERMGLIRSNEE